MPAITELEARKLAARVASELVLPAPTRYLDEGMEAVVFATTDPDWVVRVGTGDREELLLDEDFEEGVTRVLHMRFEGEYILTWKERVTPSVEWFLRKKLRKKNAELIGHALLGMHEFLPGRIALLSRWGPTRGLAIAMSAGLPTNDLDLRSNLGVTSDGRIVAYDL